MYTYLYDKLFENKALDVYSTPIFMKKNRPAYMLSVICYNHDKENIEEIIFKETTTFGIRSYKVDRSILERDFTKINTKYGDVSVKNGYLKGEKIKSSFEFEDLKRLAIENNIEISKIINECSKSLNS